MATRHQEVAPQQQRDGGSPAGKQQKAAADRKSRQALGDIGNLVNVRVAEGKPLPPVNRPMTRSLRAQLLANAQAAMAAVDKKSLDIVAGGVPKRGAMQVAKQKVVVKPKPEVVIETNTETTEEVKQKPIPKISSCSAKPSRKDVHTLTSVLTARSKVACGITDRPKELIPNIDIGDVEDQLAVVDYVEDIYKFYKLSENGSRPHDYMDSQVEINAKMRAILIDWLIEVHGKFELTPETLYLTVSVIDRYLTLETVLRRELQLVGVSAMLIACKYEEIWAPEVNDFICISDRAYTREQILGMEKEILNKLEWTLTVPTPYVFLVRFIKAAMSDKELENMVFLFAELGLMQYSLITMYCPSMLAASAIYAARCTLKMSPLWTEILKCHTSYSESQLLDCAQILVNCHRAAPEGKLQVVYKKYSSTQLGCVALNPPATKLIEKLKASSRT